MATTPVYISWCKSVTFGDSHSHCVKPLYWPQLSTGCGIIRSTTHSSFPCFVFIEVKNVFPMVQHLFVEFWHASQLIKWPRHLWLLSHASRIKTHPTLMDRRFSLPNHGIENGNEDEKHCYFQFPLWSEFKLYSHVGYTVCWPNCIDIIFLTLSRHLW